MKEKETNDKSIKNNDNNKGMKSELMRKLMRIIEENKEVEIDGNKFKFFKEKKDPNKGYFDSFCDDSSYESEHTDVIINKDEDENEKTKTKSQVYLNEDGLELEIPYGDYAKINLKNHVFYSFRSVKVSEDFSIRSICGVENNPKETESFEGIYLSEFKKPINIHGQNFYIFDENKNIKGIRKQITFEFNPNYVNEELEEELEEKLGKELEDYKKELEKKLEEESEEESEKKLEDCEKELKCYEEKLEDKKMKYNLLKIIKGMNEDYDENIYLTFKGNNAYALINDKLHFFEKTGKVYEEKIVKKVSDGFIAGLTAFKDKVFVKCLYANEKICDEKNSYEEDDSFEHSLDKKSDNCIAPSLGENVAKIKVFQQKTGKLEAILLSDEYINYYLRESNFDYLNRIDSKKFNVIFNENDFDKKLKEYFDKRAKITDNILKEDVKENLNKINDNGIKKID